MTTTIEVSDIQTRLEQLKQGTQPSFEDLELIQQQEPEVAALYLQWLQEQNPEANTPSVTVALEIPIANQDLRKEW